MTGLVGTGLGNTVINLGLILSTSRIDDRIVSANNKQFFRPQKHCTEHPKYQPRNKINTNITLEVVRHAGWMDPAVSGREN